jgi:predicted alpha-1,2-mannosidase
MNAFTEISEVKIDASQHRITGYVTTAASGFMQIEGWKEYKSYFILQFNQPFISFGTWENSSGNISKNKSADQGNGIGAYVAFKKGTTVDVKVTLSHISMEQAEITLNKELGTVSNFNEVKEVAGKAWNDALKQILVEGGTESQRETFYSCLFRASRYPANEYELDQNGSAHYYNLDDGKVHDGYHYFSPIFWDGFRCLFALQNILHPTFIGQYVQSLLPAYKISGWFPYGGIMIGNNIMSVFAEAWSKGIRTFNPDSVLKAYLQEVMHSKPVPILDPNRGKGRPGYTDYFTLGYVSFPQGERKNLETTSRTLEFAYNDFCAYQLAKMTHNTFYEKIFERSMYNYKNVFDTKDHFMKGRDADGNWDKSFNPYQWGGAFVEGNSWQWTWSVFHDVQGLINLMGGDRSFITKLDSLFAAPSDSVLVGGYGFMIHEINEAVEQKLGQYAGGNEPCFHVGYLYDYCGQPWKTQQFLRLSMNKLFNAGPDGYPGDLDMGATAAWYVLSALGIYSVTPGTNQYVIGSPLFDKATITMEDGKQFVIKADHNNASNVYIQNALLNGRTYNHNWITYDDIVNGGVLHFDMGADPNLKRGIEKEDRPFSVSAARQ